MPTRDIITLPDPILRTESAPIERVDDDVRTLVADMLETMYAAPGVGLAGIQVGIARRLFVADVSRDDDNRQPLVFLNPEILWQSETPRSYEEGCLSIPDMYAEMERPDAVRLRYMDLDGAIQEADFEGFLATVVQHEMDHLDGLLFIDHLSKLKRDRLVKKYMKAQKEKTGVL